MKEKIDISEYIAMWRANLLGSEGVRTLISALIDEVNRLAHNLMLAESALGEVRAYLEIGQGDLGEIIDHYQKNEEVEMPNVFDEL